MAAMAMFYLLSIDDVNYSRINADKQFIFIYVLGRDDNTSVLCCACNYYVASQYFIGFSIYPCQLV